jgi:hypothetical protein
VRFEIAKAELEKQSDEELQRLAGGLGVTVGNRPAMIEALCWILAPRGPTRKKKLTTV